MKLWNTLTTLAREPHPQIAQMAGDIIAHISNQVDSVGRDIEAPARPGPGGSASLPPSPNTRGDHLAAHTHTLPGTASVSSAALFQSFRVK